MAMLHTYKPFECTFTLYNSNSNSILYIEALIPNFQYTVRFPSVHGSGEFVKEDLIFLFYLKKKNLTLF